MIKGSSIWGLHFALKNLAVPSAIEANIKLRKRTVANITDEYRVRIQALYHVIVVLYREMGMALVNDGPHFSGITQPLLLPTQMRD